MNNHTSPTAVGGCAAFTFDKDACSALHERTNRTGRNFSLDCVEHSLDRLLANPIRSSSGKKLADSLYRDARKSLGNQSRPGSLIDPSRVAARWSDPLVEVETVREVAAAAATLRSALDDLPSRLQSALVLTTETLTQHQMADQLGVKPRQFRNLVRQAQSLLNQFPGVARALTVVRQGFDVAPYPTAEACRLALEGWGKARTCRHCSAPPCGPLPLPQ